jgi:hypothetical protein
VAQALLSRHRSLSLLHPCHCHPAGHSASNIALFFRNVTNVLYVALPIRALVAPAARDRPRAGTVLRFTFGAERL